MYICIQIKTKYYDKKKGIEMGLSTLIVGASGSGKSSSIGKIPKYGIEGLDPKTTFILNVSGKELPFKGSAVNYTTYDKDTNPLGNTATVSDPREIIRWMSHINKTRLDIKNLIIEDNTHIYAGEYMERVGEKEYYAKFNDIAFFMYKIVNLIKTFRDDLFTFVMHHAEETGDGLLEPKQIRAITIGKLVDTKLGSYESFFTVVLIAVKIFEDEKSQCFFMTELANSSCKTPVGMFDDVRIKNDLGYVQRKIKEYYNNPE